MDDEFSDRPQNRFDQVINRLALLEAKTRAAHDRMDKLDIIVRDELKDLKVNIKYLSDEIKDLMGWMNRGKGWAAAFLLIIGVMGGTLATILVKVVKWSG